MGFHQGIGYFKCESPAKGPTSVSTKKDVSTFVIGIDGERFFLIEIHFTANFDGSYKSLDLNSESIDMQSCYAHGLAVFHLH